MYGLNVFAAIVFGLFNTLAAHMCRFRRELRLKILRMFSLVLLVGNLIRYTLPPLMGLGLEIPVEFSTIAYFVTPAVILSGNRCMRNWAAYSGLMSGFFYNMAMVIAGGAIYGTHPPRDIYISMFCHGTLYLCGLMTISTEPCSCDSGYRLILGIALVALRAVVLRPVAENGKRLLIYVLLDAQPVKWLMPDGCMAAVPVYYSLLFVLVLISVRAFFKIWAKRYLRFVRHTHACSHIC